MKKVYIPNKSIHDFSAAEPFGELVFLSEGSLSRYKSSRIYRLFQNILKDSKRDDYLLVSGLTVLNLIAALILYDLHGQVNLLLFRNSNKGKHYLERVIKIDNKET